MVDLKEARQKEWNEQFGDHTECPVCGTACEMLFMEEASPSALAHTVADLTRDIETLVGLRNAAEQSWARELRRAEAAEAERDLFKRRLATSEECRDILHAENEKLRGVLSTVKTYGHLLPSMIRDDVEQAISPSPKPAHSHVWGGSQWDDQGYCQCGAIKKEDGTIVEEQI